MRDQIPAKLIEIQIISLQGVSLLLDTHALPTMNQSHLKRLALLMAVNCVRNTVIEDYRFEVEGG